LQNHHFNQNEPKIGSEFVKKKKLVLKNLRADLELQKSIKFDDQVERKFKNRI